MQLACQKFVTRRDESGCRGSSSSSSVMVLRLMQVVFAARTSSSTIRCVLEEVLDQYLKRFSQVKPMGCYVLFKASESTLSRYFSRLILTFRLPEIFKISLTQFNRILRDPPLWNQVMAERCNQFCTYDRDDDTQEKLGPPVVRRFRRDPQKLQFSSSSRTCVPACK